MEEQYKADYEEVQCIGRGNFGAAYLVNHRVETGKQYIAKKVHLSGLKQKEKEGAMLEVNLLKNLDHPHIVAYKQSYFTLEQLIIIMEYCEVGDLSYHIKRRQSKNERFTEEEIFNWFIQICLALEYIHARRVIHRDLKSQNIFLTGNYTIKLGDFGISRVLDNTNAAAQTVVGTPYYMSPEACQSNPYTSKSDVWSLGCILHELCTLDHAFKADNLLGLVFKIVQEEPPPIPDYYSTELQDLIKMLLVKDPDNRPSVRDILKQKIIREKAEAFVQSNSQPEIQRSKTVVFKKNMPRAVVPGQNPPEQQQQQDLAPDEIGLTPKQLMQLRKQKRADAQGALMKQGSVDAKKNYEYAQDMKNQELHAGTRMKQQYKDMSGPEEPSNPYDLYQKPQWNAEATQFQGMDRTGAMGSTGAGGLTQQFGDMSIVDPSQSQMNRFNSPAQGGGNQAEFSGYQQSQFFNRIEPNAYQDDDRPINAKGSYQITENEKGEIIGQGDDIRYVDNLEEEQQAEEDSGLFVKVMEGMQNYLQKQVTKKDGHSSVKKQDSFREDKEESKIDSFTAGSEGMISTEQKKEALKQEMGPQVFNYYYDFLYQHRLSPQTDEAKMRQQLKEMIGSNREFKNLVFELEQIIFREIQERAYN